MATKKVAEGAGVVVEVDGITVTVMADVDDDYSIVEAAYVARDPHASADEKTMATIKLYHTLLGGDYDRVMGELRERNDGRLPTSAVIGFMGRVVSEARAAKNS